jgi:hypothetical protein
MSAEQFSRREKGTSNVFKERGTPGVTRASLNLPIDMPTRRLTPFGSPGGAIDLNAR